MIKWEICRQQTFKRRIELYKYLPCGKVDCSSRKIWDDNLEVCLDGVHLAPHLPLDADLAEICGDRIETTGTNDIYTVLHSFLNAYSVYLGLVSFSVGCDTW